MWWCPCILPLYSWLWFRVSSSATLRLSRVYQCSRPPLNRTVQINSDELKWNSIDNYANSVYSTLLVVNCCGWCEWDNWRVALSIRGAWYCIVPEGIMVLEVMVVVIVARGGLTVVVFANCYRHVPYSHPPLTSHRFAFSSIGRAFVCLHPHHKWVIIPPSTHNAIGWLYGEWGRTIIRIPLKFIVLPRTSW